MSAARPHWLSGSALSHGPVPRHAANKAAAREERPAGDKDFLFGDGAPVKKTRRAKRKPKARLPRLSRLLCVAVCPRAQ